MPLDVRRIRNRVRTCVSSRFFMNIDKNYRNTIFLAGTGRSGTTWISDLLNYKNEYRYIFEPFYPQKVDICRKFKYRQYLRPEQQDEDFLGPAHEILTGNFRNKWTDKFNKKFLAQKRLVKDIRANLILKWIYVNFSGLPIILLLRHPCAVASSKIRINWSTHLEEFLSQQDLMDDFLYPFKSNIENANNSFEKHIFLWCIENYIPLKQFKKGDVHLAFYENFCLQPDQEIRSLFSYLGKEFNERILASLDIPSMPSRKWSAVYGGENLITSWKKHITAEQTKRATEILALFGLDGIYSEDLIPNTAEAYKLMTLTS